VSLSFFLGRMTRAKELQSSKCIGGCRSPRYRRRSRRIPSDMKKNCKQSRSSRPGPRSNQFHIAVILSMMVWLLACIIINDPPILVSAFVQNGNSRPSAQWNTLIQKNHIRQLPTLPRRILAPLPAKQDDNDKDSSEKEPSLLGSFFKRGDKTDDQKGKTKSGKKDDKEEGEDESKLKGIPVVGRLFATEEQKEEKRRVKTEQKEEKERLKMYAKEERLRREQDQKRLEKDAKKDDDDDENSGVVPNVKNYFRERQIRKDAKVLRFEVKRMEGDRQKQYEKDAEELRLAVKQREADRKQKSKLKLPTAPVVTDRSSSIPTGDIVRRKIQTQKELDKKRRERRNNMPPTRPNKQDTGSDSNDKDDEKSGGSKSQRFGNAVSAAQKFVSNVFDGKSEEWIVLAPKTRISPGEIVALTAAGIDLLLVASKDGQIHCTANSCPHLGTPLEVGTLARLPTESPPGSSIPNSKSSKIQPVQKGSTSFKEKDIAGMLKQDGCEDCIVCPLHRTAFALKSGEVRGEWCPYPPVIGKLTGAVKKKANLPVFDVRTKGKNIEVRLNTPVEIDDDSSKKKKKKR